MRWPVRTGADDLAERLLAVDAAYRAAIASGLAPSGMSLVMRRAGAATALVGPCAGLFVVARPTAARGELRIDVFDDHGDRSWRVVTADRGPQRGCRVVRGLERRVASRGEDATTRMQVLASVQRRGQAQGRQRRA